MALDQTSQLERKLESGVSAAAFAQLPDKLLPDAVAAMLAAKVRDGASKVYLKVQRFYLGQLAAAFHCQLRSVTTSQLSDFFRGMAVSGRSRNNARGTVGAFFKFCKERGWLP